MERFLVVGSEETQKYTFDRYIFLYFIFLILICAVALIIYLGGFDANQYLYVECKTRNNSFCENPLFNNNAYCGKTIDKNSFACTQQVIPNGFTYGSKPPSIINWWGNFVGVGLLFAFIFNHLLYNRKFSFKKLWREFDKDLNKE